MSYTTYPLGSVLFGSLVHDFGTLNAQTSSSQNLTIIGASTSDVAYVERPNAVTLNMFVAAAITAPNTISITISNPSASNISSGGTQTYKVIVFRKLS